ncbi:MAG: hypothetical protein IPM07_14295 [Anaerolineales bacterium]|nr:hypothetical protein [Anaerolineales bacterium]
MARSQSSAGRWSVAWKGSITTAALDRTLADDATFRVDWQPDLLHGVTTLRSHGDDGDLLFAPYYAWGHRGLGEMVVWMNREAA